VKAQGQFCSWRFLYLLGSQKKTAARRLPSTFLLSIW
jgi:hypothetical protein